MTPSALRDPGRGTSLSLAPDPGLDPGLDPLNPILGPWRAAVDPDDVGMFAKRLAWGGLTAAAAVSLLAAGDPKLGGDPAPDAGRCAGQEVVPLESEDPPWWPVLARLSASCREAAAGPPDDEIWLAGRTADLPAGVAEIPFVELVWPLVESATADLLPGSAAAGQVLSAAALSGAQAALARQLSELVTRPLAGQLAQGRPVGRALMLALGVLAEEPRRARYAALCRGHLASGLDDLLVEFPVLGRLLGTRVMHWALAVAELATRVSDDARLLALAFGAAEPILVQSLHLGAGDFHRGGRSVAILELGARSGGVTKVVYKPKDLRIEHGFHRLAAEFAAGPAALRVRRVANASGVLEPEAPTAPVRRAVTVVPVGESHGYVEFVEHIPAATPALLGSFYREAGRLLALLHLLGATDCHLENLIARGSELVLIDAETLFDTTFRALPGAASEVAREPGRRDLATSVLAVGMLPTWLRDERLAIATDISALGAEQPASGVRASGWLNVNTDAMVWGRLPAHVRPMLCLPVPAGHGNPLPAHAEELSEGFADGYRAVMDPTMREHLLARIAEFRGARRRVVMRATRTYAVLANRAQAPDALGSANARALELERLSRHALLGSHPSGRWAAFLAEVHDLENLDIPYFDQELGGCDLTAADQVIADAIADDGLALAADRVRGATEEDLAWQLQLIRATVGTRAPLRVEAPPTPNDHVGQVTESDRDEALADILAVIERVALRDPQGRATWLTLNPVGTGSQVELQVMGHGFYGGRAGLAAFLAALGQFDVRETVRERAMALACQAWGAVAADLDRDDYDTFRMIRDHGLGFSGAGGLLRALGLGYLPVSQHSRQEARRVLVTAIRGLLDRDVALDQIGGSAGAIAPLVALGDGFGDVVRGLGDRLVAAADPLTGAWSTPVSRLSLCGFSHGASGFGLALLQAGTALRDEEFIRAGARAFAFESALFDEQVGNWPDLRVTSPPAGVQPDAVGSGANGRGPIGMVAWCHGAPGIALSRMRALELAPGHPDAEAWRRDLTRGTRATVAAPLATQDHLCCGNLGRAAVLTAIGNSPATSAEIRGAALAGAQEITAAVLSRWRASGYFRLDNLGVGGSVGSAAFMTGLAGVGMHLIGEPARADLTSLLC